MRSQSDATPDQRTRLAAHLIAKLGTGRAAPTVLARRAPSQVPAALPRSRERYVLFAPALVQAILDGRKTVTRRLIAPPGKPAGPCPFGEAGDRLWVREKWGYRGEFFDRRARGVGPFVYAADGPPAGATVLAWRPSLHMPRAACRVELGVTGSRAERLTAMTSTDALVEGCPLDRRSDPVGWFRQTWDGFYAAGRAGWCDDPWVWVISFDVLKLETA